MNVEEMKKQIVDKVEIMDEEALQEILNIINGNKSEPALIDATKKADYLFNKHDGLLKRLA